MDAPSTASELPEVRPADAPGLAAAAQRLRGGGLVAVPTETVYGLAARADRADAVAAIYAAKGRPSANPLIVHLADAAAVGALAEMDARGVALGASFWPGPLTLVLPLRHGHGLAPAVTAGRATVAVRVPAHPVMRALVEAVGPLAAPSANRSGHVSPTRASHVLASLGPAVPLVLDGGPCAVGLESTIVQLLPGVPARLLRAGAVPAEAIEAVIGPFGEAEAVADSNGELVAPGMMASHYAPLQPVRLAAATADRHEFHIGFGAVSGDLNLSATGDLAEAGAALFAALHLAEASGRAGIAVAPVPEVGLGRAINDRLRRAAAKRD